MKPSWTEFKRQIVQDLRRDLIQPDGYYGYVTCNQSCNSCPRHVSSKTAWCNHDGLSLDKSKLMKEISDEYPELFI